ncbi:GDP-mannose 4,6-dehydratase [Candidatus Gottesmanbacteria bacterium]|nr:GDP-mannose 4,6-dehydratase [Candidatus Gottesmanbacteria bacterium]
MNVLITGGAGFIGINASSYFLRQKHQVTIFDNFSRPGCRDNISWLNHNYKSKVRIIEGDICTDRKKLLTCIRNVDAVLHLAGQVAVTTSVEDPVTDFAINARGTLNVLESIRESGSNPMLIYSSTNKVYGSLKDLRILESKTRYVFQDLNFGVPETQNLDFYSPYGCSKGAADQYVHDYSRIYGLNTIVFRQSCIYGSHQYGMEDQGWVAWFIIALLQQKKLTIYGNGKQVRDLLYIDDLLRAYDLALKHINVTKGQIYNIGGGPQNTISIWYELKPLLEKLFKKKISATFSDWRPGDQPIYISDIRKAKKDFLWKPRVPIRLGMKYLYDWIRQNTQQVRLSKMI